MTDDELKREIRRAERNAKQLAQLLTDNEAHEAATRAALGDTPTPTREPRLIPLPPHALRG